MAGGATILHADLDAFYASVEQLLDPALRGRPVAVGGSARGGVVLAASYEAKRFGVSGGMAGRRARELCPQLTFVRGHFGEYQRFADAVMERLHDVTPAVERISIGAARTKHLAKVASQVAKPDGLVVVEPGTERSFLDPLPVGLMWGVGPVTERRLAERGIRTIGDLARTPSRAVERLLGDAVGAKLAALAHDEDPRRIATSHRARSVGAQSAIGRHRPTPELVHDVLAHLADRVAGRMRAKGRSGRTITVRVRFTGMRAVTRSLTLPAPVATTLTLTEVGEALAWQAIRDEGPDAEITLLAISVSGLAVTHAVQTELPIPPDDPRRPGSATDSARWAVDTSMDAIRRRFGRDAVGCLPTALARRHGVPDDFRELAERDL